MYPPCRIQEEDGDSSCFSRKDLAPSSATKQWTIFRGVDPKALSTPSREVVAVIVVVDCREEAAAAAVVVDGAASAAAEEERG